MDFKRWLFLHVMLVMGVCLLASPARGLVLWEEGFDDPNNWPVLTTFITGNITGAWGDHVFSTALSSSPPYSLYLRTGSGAEGVRYVVSVWALDRTYDFYRNGTGVCSVKAARSGGATWAALQLYNGDTLVGEGRHTFEDYSAFHDIVIDTDPNATAVDTIVFVGCRGTGAFSMYVHFDDFSFQADYAMCGDPVWETMPGDADGDCYITLNDFAALANHWQQCSDPADSSCDPYWLP